MKLICQIFSASFNSSFTTLMLIIMSIQIVPIEGYALSPIKIGLMILALLVFLFRVPYITKALWFSFIYWLVCYFTALFHGDLRFSTLGYLGMFLISFLVFYNFIHIGTFTFVQFKKILKFLLISYCITLLLQQICIIIGIYNIPILNLVGLNYYEWNRLPVLSCEPSHTATIISAVMLGYIRCLEIEQHSKVGLKLLFNRDNRLVTISYFWLIFTIGSGTGWIAFGIMCLYFVRPKTFIYTIPIIAVFLGGIKYFGNKQFERVIVATEATFSGNIKNISQADGSASARIIPLVNTLIYTDLTKKESWIGGGTLSKDGSLNYWKNLNRKIPVVEQYGLLGLVASLFLIYTCSIRYLFSLETLYFIILLQMSIINAYVVWSMIFIFTAINYFQEQDEKEYLSNC